MDDSSKMAQCAAPSRKDDRNRFIYLAQAIDLNEKTDEMQELLRFANLASEALQIPVFDPRAAWSRSVLDVGPNANQGRNALAGLNQTLALAADLLIAVFDLRTPSWGMPYEVLSRAEQRHKPIIMVSPNDPREYPLYLQWVLGGNATWVNWQGHRSTWVEEALNQVGMVTVS